jgi:hypothetical protein
VRYTTRACDFCKARHLRCDGQDICFQCKKRNQLCNYTQKNVKRGPKPKKKKKKDGDDFDQSLSGDETPMTGTPVWKQELFCNPTRPMDYPVAPFPVMGQKSLDYDLLRPQPFPRDPTIAIEPSYEVTLTSFVAFDQKNITVVSE